MYKIISILLPRCQQGTCSLESTIYLSVEFSCTITINFSWNFPFHSWNFFELHPPNVNPLATTPAYDESYTWKVGKDKQGRLDYAFVCPELINFITGITHKWHSHDVSDHASVDMVIDFENTKKWAGIFRAPAEILI